MLGYRLVGRGRPTQQIAFGGEQPFAKSRGYAEDLKLCKYRCPHISPCQRSRGWPSHCPVTRLPILERRPPLPPPYMQLLAGTLSNAGLPGHLTASHRPRQHRQSARFPALCTAGASAPAPPVPAAPLETPHNAPCAWSVHSPTAGWQHLRRGSAHPNQQEYWLVAPAPTGQRQVHAAARRARDSIAEKRSTRATLPWTHNDGKSLLGSPQVLWQSCRQTRRHPA